MKYLLSILVLFSGFSFGSKIHMICDTDYIFYPELKERRTITLDLDKNHVDIYFIDNDGLSLKSVKWGDLATTTSSFKWGNLSKYLASYRSELNRKTGILIRKSGFENYIEYECKKVSAKKRSEATDELQIFMLENQKERKF